MTDTTIFLYIFNYDYHHEELCKLESRQVFSKEVKDKFLFSEKEINPNLSPFIKSRMDVLASTDDYAELLQLVLQLNIELHDFNVEYLILTGDSANKSQRREKQKDIGFCIHGRPDFKNPKITYAICLHQGVWYFGELQKEDAEWHKHRQKPHSFSNSIGTIIAKTLVSLAAKGNTDARLIDACCGVGTVVLEACISGFHIEGCDINVRAYQHAVQNLEHYNYTAKLHFCDIKDLETRYDAAIIDLPYNLYSLTGDNNTASHIISAAAALADRLVIVSIADIEDVIHAAGMQVVDYCTVVKRGKSLFTRKIWVCVREKTLAQIT